MLQFSQNVNISTFHLQFFVSLIIPAMFLSVIASQEHSGNETDAGVSEMQKKNQ